MEDKKTPLKGLRLHGSKYIYCLDAGHGSDTPGKRSPKWEDGTQLLEWQYTRIIRNSIINLLELYKISYYVVNLEDEDISLSERAKRINKLNKNNKTITISLHGNAAGVEEANGYEVWTSPGQTKSDTIADVFYKHAERTKMLRMRRDTSDGDNDKEARFSILTKTNGPAILTETGFYTNEEECHNMMTEDFIGIVALMHTTAILEIENTL